MPLYIFLQSQAHTRQVDFALSPSHSQVGLTWCAADLELNSMTTTGLGAGVISDMRIRLY